MLTGKYIKQFYLSGSRSWEIHLFAFVECHSKKQRAVTSSAKHVYHKLLESNHHNFLGSTKMLWLNSHNKGCAQKAPLLFWVGFIWRKWNVILVRSQGRLCLFNSLGGCKVQEAAVWRQGWGVDRQGGRLVSSTRPPGAWQGKRGWQVQRRQMKSSIRWVSWDWSPSLQGKELSKGGEGVHSIIVKNSSDTLFMRKIRQGNYRKEQEATSVFQSDFQYLTTTSEVPLGSVNYAVSTGCPRRFALNNGFCITDE